MAIEYDPEAGIDYGIRNDPAAPAARYIIECMAAKGYDFEIEPAACNSRYPLPTQSTCYKSNNWLAGIIDQFRQSQQSN